MGQQVGLAASIDNLNKILKIIGGKWKISIICSLNAAGIIRYGELKRKIEGISNTMLANSLQELESDNLITRTLYDEMPLRVEYELTPLCKSLIPLLLELNTWVDKNIP